VDRHASEEGTRLHKVGKAFRRMSRVYAPQEERHLGGHLGAVVAFGAYTVAWDAVVAVRKTKLPERPVAQDLLLTATAVFRLGRLLSKGSVRRGSLEIHGPGWRPWSRVTTPISPGENPGSFDRRPRRCTHRCCDRIGAPAWGQAA